MGHRDVLAVKGMQFWGTHGYFPEENRLGQKFVIDVEAVCDLQQQCETDDYNPELSYTKLFKAAKKVVTTEEHKLLQKIALRIIEEVKETCKPIESVKVTVKKPFVAMGGILDYSSVTIER